jgi:hypothetical protein
MNDNNQRFIIILYLQSSDKSFIRHFYDKYVCLLKLLVWNGTTHTIEQSIKPIR